MNTYVTAMSYRNSGLSVIPIATDGSKAPAKIAGETAPYEEHIADTATIKKWFNGTKYGIAVYGGAVSGNLERMDFDYFPVWLEWLQLIAEFGHIELYNSLCEVETPADGRHLWFRCSEPASKSGPIARMRGEDGKLHPTIEMKSEGGYCLAPGSPKECHELHKEYKILRGDICELPILSGEERDILVNLAKSLDREPAKIIGHVKSTKDPSSGERPGDDYNNREEWREVISGAGWTHTRTVGECEFWCRPGKRGGTSGTWNYMNSRTFYCFTSNADPLEQYVSYTPFGLFATFKYPELPYPDNFKAAAAELANIGLGTPPVPVKPPTKTRTVSMEKECLTLEIPPPGYFFNLVPDGYIKQYIDYASKENDSPQEFHLATALWTISAVAGNKISAHFWHQDIYPHLWMILIAPSGFYRKTSSISIGKSLLRHVDENIIYPDDFSREKLQEAMQTKPDGSIVASEFGEMLSKMGLNYMQGTKEFLTTIYDGRTYQKNLMSKSIKIENPAVSFVGASTIEWLEGRVSEEDKHSGFLARYTYWIAENKSGWKGIPEEDEEWDYKTHNNLVSQLKDFATYSGEAHFSKEVRKQFNEWLQPFENGVNERKLPDGIQGFFTRLGMYCLKFAMIYNLALGYELNISPEAMSYAIRLTAYLARKVEMLLCSELATTQEHKDQKRIIRTIKENNGKATRSELLRATHFPKKRLDELLETLGQAEQIECVIDNGVTKPITYYSIVGSSEKR